MKTKNNLIADDYGVYTDDLRKIPLGGGANILASKQSFHREMAFRKERNKKYNIHDPILKWENLEKYEGC